MDKDIKHHELTIVKKLKNITDSNSPNKVTRQKLLDLARYNQSAISNFQHERLVHLVVTLFFGLISITFAIYSLLIVILPLCKSVFKYF